MIFAVTLLLLAASANACNIACQANWDPLCGTDGRTYGNGCELDATNCLAKTAVAVAYAGECAQVQQCNIACQMNWDPLCGTDGQTYGNGCQLESTNCLQKTAVTAAHAGECVQAAPECNIACQMNWDPLCGTDGQTYGNGCQLESTNCLQKTSVTAAYAGECVRATSQCNIACQMNYDPICGTDGHTYGNGCEMEASNCLNRKSVTAAYAGECAQKEQCNIACHFNYAPVCGTDGQTYGNSCELDSLSCLKKSGVTVAYSGECAMPIIPVQSVCNEACLRNWQPVCGSDGITYGNLCQMESFACTKRLNLLVEHEGEC